MWCRRVMWLGTMPLPSGRFHTTIIGKADCDRCTAKRQCQHWPVTELEATCPPPATGPLGAVLGGLRVDPIGRPARWRRERHQRFVPPSTGPQVHEA